VLFGFGPSLLDAGGTLRALAAQRQGVDEMLGCAENLRRTAQLACTRPRPGKDHFGTTIGWPTVVVERTLCEPALDKVDQLAVMQRVPCAGSHLVDRWSGRVRALAATAMMAATTRSTGMTSTMPSGTPGTA